VSDGTNYAGIQVQGLTLEKLARLTGLVYNVKAYGAKGDGSTNDQPAIEAALSGLSTDGGVLYFPAGTYIVALDASDRSIYISQSNVTLYLAQGATIKLRNNELSGSLIGNVVKIGDGTSALSDIRITGPGKIDGNRANNPSAGTITTGATIYVHGPCTDILIDCAGVVNASRDAIYIYGESPASRAERITIRGVRIDNSAEGIVWARADHVTVDSCHVTTTAEQDGIEPAEDSSYWQISNNYLSGIHSSNVPIDVFSNAGACEHGVVAYNRIVGNQVYGITVGAGATGPTTDVLILGNSLDDCGIQIGENAAAVEDVRIVNNRLRGAGSNNVAGINVQEPAVVITGNMVSEFDLMGIQVGAENAIIRDNVVYNNGQDTGESAANRVGIKTATRNTIVAGNLIYDDQGAATQHFGIFADSSTNALVVNNIIYGNITAPVSKNAALTAMLAHNRGFVSENAGTATVPSGSTGISVPHGLTAAPTGSLRIEHVTVTPTNNLGNATKFWVGTINDNIFSLLVDADPGATTATFVWQARIDPLREKVAADAADTGDTATSRIEAKDSAADAADATDAATSVKI
jgi:hypothetical protein